MKYKIGDKAVFISKELNVSGVVIITEYLVVDRNFRIFKEPVGYVCKYFNAPSFDFVAFDKDLHTCTPLAELLYD